MYVNYFFQVVFPYHCDYTYLVTYVGPKFISHTAFGLTFGLLHIPYFCPPVFVLGQFKVCMNYRRVI